MLPTMKVRSKSLIEKVIETRVAYWTSTERANIESLMRMTDWLIHDPKRRAIIIEKGYCKYRDVLMKDNYNFFVSTLKKMIKERRML